MAPGADDDHGNDHPQEGPRAGLHAAHAKLSPEEAHRDVDAHQYQARHRRRLLRYTEEQRQAREGADVDAHYNSKNLNGYL